MNYNQILSVFVLIVLLPSALLADEAANDAIRRSRSTRMVDVPVVIQSASSEVCVMSAVSDVGPKGPVDIVCLRSPSGGCLEPKACATKGNAVIDVTLGVSQTFPSEKIQDQSKTCSYKRAPLGIYAKISTGWDEYCYAFTSCESDDGSSSQERIACPHVGKEKVDDGELLRCPSVSECYKTKFKITKPTAPTGNARRSSKAPAAEASAGIVHKGK